MTKIIGQCINCGSNEHPKGNVFRLMQDWDYDLSFPHKPSAPTATVKVCNNCNTAHPFKRRISAKAKARNELFERLLSEIGE